MAEDQLVGRTHELAAAVGALDAGETAGPLVVGSAGVGKTRLAHAVADLVRQRGRRVRVVLPMRALSEIPFGAFGPLLPSQSSPDRGAALAAAERLLGIRHDPLVLLIDDAHLLDSDSLALLTRLVMPRRAQVIATARNDAPLPRALTDLWKDEHLLRLPLEPLPPDDAERLVRSLLGPIATGVAEGLDALARGNPLYLRELIADARSAGALEQIEGVWQLTGDLSTGSRLAEVITRRLEDVEPPARALLSAIAFAERLAVDVCLRLASSDDLDSLEQLHLVTIDAAGGTETVSVGHPLHGEVLLATLTTARRRQLMSHLADALVGAGLPLPGDARRAAVWQLHATGRVSADVALQGAAEALAMFATSQAEQLARHALEAGDSARARLLLARSLSFQARYAEAEGLLARGEAQAADEADRVEFVAARAYNLGFGLGNPQEAAVILQAAAATAKDRDLHARLLADRALFASVTGDFQAVVDATDPILAHEVSPIVRLTAVVNRTLADVMRMVLSDVPARVQEGLALAEALVLDAPLAASQLQTNRLMDLLGRAEVADAVALAEHLYDPEVVTTPGTAILRAMNLGYCRTFSGDLDGAAHLCRLALATEDVDPLGLRSIVPGYLSRVEAMRNRLGATRSLLQAEDGAPPGIRAGVWFGRARAWLAAQEQETDEAERLALKVAAESAEAQHVLWSGDALHDAVRFGRATQAVVRLTELRRYTEGAVLLDLYQRHAEGVEAASGPTLFDVAASLAAGGATLLAAEAAMQAGSCYQRQRQQTDACRAETYARALRGSLRGADTPALRLRVPGLTARQFAVAQLAASGAASATIGRGLRISTRTVDNHLSAVYRALGIGHRDELRSLFPSAPAQQPLPWTRSPI
jgi:DNA-binding CsgD family transcriptional regulator